jgi:hypothetical protein
MIFFQPFPPLAAGFGVKSFVFYRGHLNEFELIFYSQQLITEGQAATARFGIFARIVNISFGLKTKLNQGFEDERSGNKSR